MSTQWTGTGVKGAMCSSGCELIPRARRGKPARLVPGRCGTIPALVHAWTGRGGRDPFWSPGVWAPAYPSAASGPSCGWIVPHPCPRAPQCERKPPERVHSALAPIERRPPERVRSALAPIERSRRAPATGFLGAAPGERRARLTLRLLRANLRGLVLTFTSPLKRCI
jgi:hypothetical protein